jgi:hypothetical protein
MKSRVRTRTHGSVRGRHPSGVPPTRLSTENSKAAVILIRCAILGPATAVFRIIHQGASRERRIGARVVARCALGNWTAKLLASPCWASSSSNNSTADQCMAIPRNSRKEKITN